MKLSSFLKLDSLNLPHNYEGDFFYSAKIILDRYLSELNSLKSIENLKADEFFKPLDFIISKQNHLISGILDTLKIYLDGHPYNAYVKFDETLRPNQQEHPGLKWLMIPHAPFYRIRKSMGKMLDVKDLFLFHSRKGEKSVVRDIAYLAFLHFISAITYILAGKNCIVPILRIFYF